MDISQLGAAHGQHINIAGTLLTDLISRPNDMTLCPARERPVSVRRSAYSERRQCKGASSVAVASRRLRKHEQIVFVP